MLAIGYSSDALENFLGFSGKAGKGSLLRIKKLRQSN